MKRAWVRGVPPSVFLLLLITLVSCQEDVTAPGIRTGPLAGPELSGDFSYTAIDLGALLGDKSSRALDVNESGWIVGEVMEGSFAQGFIWRLGDDEPLTSLNTLGFSSSARGVSNNGQVVGSFRTGSQTHGFYWNGDRGMVDLGVWGGGPYAYANAINNDSIIAGTVVVFTPSYATFAARTRYNQTWIAFAPALPNPAFSFGTGVGIDANGKIVGKVRKTSDNLCYIATYTGGAIDYRGTLGGQQCTVNAVNDDFAIVGYGQNASNDFVAFVWTEANGIVLLPSGGDADEAWAVSDNGLVVGTSRSGDQSVAVVWIPQDGWYSSYSSPQELDPLAGYTDSHARGVNAAGLVVGYSSKCIKYLPDGYCDEWEDRGTIWQAGGGEPPTREEQIDALRSEVETLVEGEVLNPGQANSLTRKLNTAQRRIDKEQYQAAVNILNDFIGQLEDLVDEGVLTEAEAQPLIDGAQALIDDLLS